MAMKAYGVPHNTAWLTAALVTQKVLSFGYFWYLSSQLDKSILGLYLFALSFATLFGGATDLGLTPVLIREIARDPPAGNRYLQNLLSLKVILCGAAVALASLVISHSGLPVVSRQLISLAMGFVVLDAFTSSLWGVLKASRNFRFESVATLVVQGVIIAGGMVVLKTTRALPHLVLGLVLASLVNFTFALLCLKRQLRYRVKPSWQQPTIRRLVRLAPAFALSVVLVRVYNVADVVLLGYLAGHVAVASYGIPAKVVTSLQQIIPAAFAAALFPVFTQLHRKRSPQLGRLFSQACGYLLGLSLPLSIALIVAAQKILESVWPTYVNVAPAWRTMAAALPFIFLSFPTGYLLNACDRQRWNTCNRGVMTALAVGANWLIIPTLGYVGSAVVFFLTQVTIVVLDGLGLWGLVQVDWRYLGGILGKTVLATTGMAAVMGLSLVHLSVLAALGAGAVTYLGLTLALQTWPSPRQLWRQLRSTA